MRVRCSHPLLFPILLIKLTVSENIGKDWKLSENIGKDWKTILAACRKFARKI